MNTQVLIVGGGLAGLSLARKLQSMGCDWQLVESRDRWGGRVLTQTIDGQGFDLGPSWFWPGQPRIDALINELNLQRFDQSYLGDLMYQDEAGVVHRGQGMASMQGSWRLEGGLARLIETIANELPEERLHLNTAVESIRLTEQSVVTNTHSGHVIKANTVVLAIPPRVASTLTFLPALPEKTIQALRNIPTWMAGHAKVVATYPTAFWKDQGLSGDAMSRQGPLAEIHDASPHDAGPYALFGFVGTPANHRRNNTEALKQAIRNQLGVLFGEQASNPEHLILKDWAFDKNTAIELDSEPLHHHPAYGRPFELKNLWGKRLHFGSTEMGGQFGGFLEGALETADELACELANA